MARVKLESLSPDEVNQTIVTSLRRTGVHFDSAVVELVKQYSNGHPFEMRVLCSNLFARQRYGRIGIEAWGRALQTAISDIGDSIFSRWCVSSSPKQMDVLRLVAEFDTACSSAEIRAVGAARRLEILYPRSRR